MSVRWRWLGCVLWAFTVAGCAADGATDEASGDSNGVVPDDPNDPDRPGPSGPGRGPDQPGGPGGPGCHEPGKRVEGDDETAIGVSAAELSNLLTGPHVAALVWAKGPSTVINMNLTGVRMFSVRTRAKRDHEPPRSTQRCANHVRVEAQLSFSTRDGKLDETVQPLTLYAFSLEELRGEFQIPAHELRGPYEPILPPPHCYQSSTFRVLFRPDGIHGAMVDTVRVTKCESDSGGFVDYAAGHWGTRWQGF